ncbi:hypothetical protein [Saccharophagus degradans]|uniref:HEPN domain-containing protein n=1 Tax=Saccharophagus degradans TaxID=86304 RepID=A0AAW7X7Z5_9GAMM|nr:hypothetical protein [Saccharophagus degradans]MDO6422881.1 hypothetical protein [Saccharophagus degradans]MDO6609302.1 hypothetical protein [Saccharophagus degradans]
MAVNPQDFVKFAYSLLKANDKQDGCEIQLRTSINRAYYGAFLTARNHAGITNSSGSVHKDVIEHYLNQKAGKVGNNLDSLKRLRQKADYEPDKTITINDAKTSCRTANTILNEVNKLLQAK